MITRQQLVGATSYTYGRRNPKRFLTIHETANTNRTANAAAHANLQSRRNPAAVSWHWQVDDKEAVQSFTHDWQLWHAGDGYRAGNLESIAIETCVNAGVNWEQTKRNLAELAVTIMRAESIPLVNVVQHNKWSGKNCPTRLRANNQREWNQLVSAIRAMLDTPVAPPFTGDAEAFVGRIIEIEAWYNYRTAGDAEALRNPVRVMPAGRYRVDRVSGQTPHLSNVNGLHSGWVHSSVLENIELALVTHTVRPGETLWGISQRYGVTVTQLQQANGVKSTLIHPGQVLVIP